MTVRLVFCLHRLQSLDRPAFLDYWRNIHGPLVCERAGVLHIRRYEQAHQVTTRSSQVLAAVRGAPEPFDGIASLWFDSIEDMQMAAGTPEGRQAASDLLADERRFIDLARSPLWFVEDHQLA